VSYLFAYATRTVTEHAKEKVDELMRLSRLIGDSDLVDATRAGYAKKINELYTELFGVLPVAQWRVGHAINVANDDPWRDTGAAAHVLAMQFSIDNPGSPFAVWFYEKSDSDPITKALYLNGEAFERSRDA
jgi:hypothetical protein